jgi:hypothetical protein
MHKYAVWRCTCDSLQKSWGGGPVRLQQAVAQPLQIQTVQQTGQWPLDTFPIESGLPLRLLNLYLA